MRRSGFGLVGLLNVVVMSAVERKGTRKKRGKINPPCIAGRERSVCTPE